MSQGASVRHSAQSLVPPGSVQLYAGQTAPHGWLMCDGTNSIDRATYPALGAVISPNKGTVTVSIASPCVVTLNGHGFGANACVFFETTGSLPTGLTAGTAYYVITVDANTFKISASSGGSAVNTSGSQSGTHTLYHSIYGPVSAVGKFKVPDMRGRAPIGAGTGSGLTNRGLGSQGGAESVTLTSAQMPPHTHTVPGYASSYAAGSNASATYSGGSNNTTTTGSTGGTGGATDSHNNMQPWIGMNYIIKT